MATKQHTTKPRRRPQAASKRDVRPSRPEDLEASDWEIISRHRPTSPARRRVLLRRALREMDDEGIATCWWSVILQAEQSAMRRDLAELARIKATCAIIPAKKVPMSEIVMVKPVKRGRKAVRS